MIFVTVGTHEQQFDRLIRYIDRLKEEGTITEDVIIQTGYSTYEPKYCQWQKLFPYDEMVKNVKEARIVITHGGPSSFIMPLQIGKVPIVVPRLKRFGEHVNDHQAAFCDAVSKRMGTILLAMNGKTLRKTIKQYDTLVGKMDAGLNSNNARFNQKLKDMVSQLFED